MLVVIYSVTELNFLTVVTALSTEQESKGLGSKEDELFFFFFLHRYILGSNGI